MNDVTSNPVVFAACKRGTDQITKGQSCDGKRATRMTPEGSSNVRFCCKECGFSWNVAIGGNFTMG